MSKTPLIKYLQRSSQADLAAAVGLTQGAISKMIRTERNIFVLSDPKTKKIQLVEEKPIAPAA